MNERRQLEIEVITPLSVGAGTSNDWIRGADYIIKGGKVYIIDLTKIVALGIGVDTLSPLLAKTDEKGICELIDDKLEQVSDYVFDLPAVSTNPIKSFLRNQLHDKPIIAGSSLKGAIRSILFNYFRTEERDCGSVLGNMKDNTDFMRFIQVGDAEMEKTSLVNSRLFNLWKERDRDIWHSGWKHSNYFTSREYEPMGFNTLYECVLPGMKGVGNIRLLNDAFLRLVSDSIIGPKIKYAKDKKELLASGIEKLFGIINDATWDYLQKEKEFFESYLEAERTNEIIDGIDFLLSQIPCKGDNSYCVLKMSAGSGFHSITGDWQYDDYTRTGFKTKFVNNNPIKIPNYKSRKIVEYKGKLQLMGFVKLQ
ncbi:MAG: hypothetical protein K6B45_10830 [Bacteroidaceae bacterium]|nr:hypothetical protein [Bacteroidaceae bacterium]